MKTCAAKTVITPSNAETTMIQHNLYNADLAAQQVHTDAHSTTHACLMKRNAAEKTDINVSMNSTMKMRNVLPTALKLLKNIQNAVWMTTFGAESLV